MGCAIYETSITPGNHFITGPIPQYPRPRLLSEQVLDQSLKEQIWNIIEQDNVKLLAFIIRQKSIDLRAQILCQKSYSTMLHLAARYNADMCAVFLLKGLYELNPAQYIESVNMQTIEGHTALHQAIIWGSYETYIELVEFGGLDLSLKDVFGADIFILAKSYKRDYMFQQLDSFRNQGVFLIRANVQELRKALVFQDIMIKQQSKIDQIRQNRRNRNRNQGTRRHKSKNFYKIQKPQEVIKLERQLVKLVEKQSEQRQKYLKQLQQLSEEHNRKKIEEEQRRNKEHQQFIKSQEAKANNDITQLISINFSNTMVQSQQQIQSKELLRIEKQKQQYDQQIRIKNQQFLRKQKQLQDQKLLKEQEEIERQKLEEQNRLKQQAKRAQQQKRIAEAKRKEEEEKKKRQLQQLEKKQQTQQIQKRKKKEEEERLKKQKQDEQKKKKLEEQIKKYNEELQRNREIAEKNRSQILQVSQISNKTSGVGKLPAQLKSLYQDSLAKKTNFIDKQFPPERKTLGTPKKFNNTVQTSKWYRPYQIFKSDYQLFDGIDPSDIKQGALGICYYLATLSSLAQNQQRIRSMFPFYDKQLGFYVVNLYINGALKNIVVDDHFPCSAGSKTPLFTRPNGKQIWVMILEKAWVKNFGDYFSAEGMAAETMMEDVAGAPSKGGKINNIIDQLPLFAESDKKKHIIVLSSMSENAPKGIVAGHAYSLIDIHDLQNPQLLKIRNPWGNFQWQGDYGDKSLKWNKELKQRLKVKEQEDGIFYMASHEVPVGFSYYAVSMVEDNAKFVSLQFTSKPLQQKYWTFEVKQKGCVNIRVTQLFDRLISDKEYKYSPLIIQCGWIKPNGNVQFLGQGSQNSVFGQKSVHFHDNLSLELQPGKYFIRVKMFWKTEKYFSARLIAYSTLDIQWTQVKAQQIKQQWIKMLQSILQTCKKSSLLSGNLSLMQKWMKGQYIIGVTNNHPSNVYEITINLPQKDFKKCVLGYGKTKQDQIKLTLNPNQTKLAGVADKIELNASSSIGKFTISAIIK